MEGAELGLPVISDTLALHRILDEIISRSQCEPGITHEAFMKEVMLSQWRYAGSKVPEDYEHVECLCGQHLTAECCIIVNRLTGEQVIIGNNCVQNFFKEYDATSRIAHTLRTGVAVKLLKECCNHYHFQIRAGARSNIVTYNAELISVCGSSPLERGTHVMRVEKSKEADYQLELEEGKDYNIMCQLIMHPTKEKALYVFRALASHASYVRELEEYVPPPQVEEEEESESLEPSSSSEAEEEPEPSSSEAQEEEDESSSEERPRPRKRGRR